MFLPPLIIYTEKDWEVFFGAAEVQQMYVIGNIFSKRPKNEKIYTHIYSDTCFLI